ncbi:MAG: hypothetical protein EXS01_02950 [Phycisphaerales bacterium]|nr:hypothetical protein [Phycisphaerales bacterium]
MATAGSLRDRAPYSLAVQGILKPWIVPTVPPTGTLVARIAAARGIPSESLKKFLAPTYQDLVPPKDLFGAVEVGERLAAAVRSGRKIAIFGDYDADGMCAAAILLHLIRAVRPEDPPIVYIPKRATEGYGLSTSALSHLASLGVQTIVSVDCGITAIEEAVEARRIGLELLITDHHTIRSDGVLPCADAIAHPGLGGGAGELCGAAVAWKVGWAFLCAWCSNDKLPTNLRELLVETLALAAFGTIADVMLIRGENRLIARLGIARIANSGLPGLRALAREAGIGPSDRVDSERVSFGLAPIVNACGRLGNPFDAVELLGLAAGAPGGSEAAESNRRAKHLAAGFAKLNQERKEIERRIVDAAQERWAEGIGSARGACVLASPDWPRGVVGIACARLAEKFGIPVVLMESEGVLAFGSSRSVEGYSVLDGLHACAALLDRYGGHAAAAGVSLRLDRLDEFRETLSAHAAANRHDAEVPTLRPDVEFFGADLTIQEIDALDALGPFGRGFRAPLVLVRSAIVTSAPRTFGAASDHGSFFARLPGSNPTEIRCTWWRQAAQMSKIARGMAVHLVASPQVDRWNGRPTPALMLLDVCVDASL